MSSSDIYGVLQYLKVYLVPRTFSGLGFLHEVLRNLNFTKLLTKLKIYVRPNISTENRKSSTVSQRNTQKDKQRKRHVPVRRGDSGNWHGSFRRFESTTKPNETIRYRT